MASGQIITASAKIVCATTTLQTLVTFSGTNGATPTGGVLLDAAGNLYGTTSSGGSYNYGTVFEIAKTPTGYSPTPTTLVTFDGKLSTGYYPGSNLLMDAQGDLIGTTRGDIWQNTGPLTRGTIFELVKTETAFASKPITLVAFRRNGGYYPLGKLSTDEAGNIFGATLGGPTPRNRFGTVFKVAKTADGYRPRQTLLTRFDQTAMTKNPYGQPSSNIIMDSAGNLFGSTTFGGPNNTGVVFELAKVGNHYSAKPRVIAEFSAPYLIMDKAGNIFAPSAYGPSGYGSVYEISKSSSDYTTTILATFDGANNGTAPGSLTFDAAGNLFGTTNVGGAYGKGTIFELAKTPTGYSATPTLIYTFTGGEDGGGPSGPLLLDSTGHIFGTSSGGGAANKGTVFEITLNNGAAVNSSAVKTADANAMCFCAGTRILTRAGEVAVEALAVGDIVVTATGGRRNVRWLGHRRLRCPAWESRPVRIAAHAFGEARPARDLFLSPGHPVLVGDDEGDGGSLVPIMCLVNGTSVRRMPVDEVDYWHVELDGHDVLLAEGLPAESFIDCGDRPFFERQADDRLVDSDLVRPGLSRRCRPVVIGGSLLEAERRRLDTIFSVRLAAACEWPEPAALGPWAG